jgi:hypothetical protein
LRAVRKAEPLAVQVIHAQNKGASKLIWRLQPGVINQFEFRCWRWSPLGLGALVIALLLALVALLQRLKLAAGFGLPQLPA